MNSKRKGHYQKLYQKPTTKEILRCMGRTLKKYVSYDIANLILQYISSFQWKCKWNIRKAEGDRFLQKVYEDKLETWGICNFFNVNDDVRNYHHHIKTTLPRTGYRRVKWIPNTCFLLCIGKKTFDMIDVETPNVYHYPYKIRFGQIFDRGVAINENHILCVHEKELIREQMYLNGIGNNNERLYYFSFPYLIQVICPCGSILVRNLTNTLEQGKCLLDCYVSFANKRFVLRIGFRYFPQALIYDLNFFPPRFIVLLALWENTQYLLLIDIETYEIVFRRCNAASRVFVVGKKIILQHKTTFSCWE